MNGQQNIKINKNKNIIISVCEDVKTMPENQIPEPIS